MYTALQATQQVHGIDRAQRLMLALSSKGLDGLYTSLYSYFYHQGFGHIVLKRLVGLGYVLYARRFHFPSIALSVDLALTFRRLGGMCRTLFFTIFFALVLGTVVDWSAMGVCGDEDKMEPPCTVGGQYLFVFFLPVCMVCGIAKRAVRCRAQMAALLRSPFRSAWRTVLVILPATGALLYFLWTVVTTVSALRHAWLVRVFYTEILHISSRELPTMHW